jgi:hypothetical protein
MSVAVKTGAVILLGYVGGFFIGSLFLRAILRLVDPKLKGRFTFRDVGVWIGLTEHFLIVTFVLMNEYTAIGLIFAAKEYVRSDKIKQKPSYYLLGTLLSVSCAIFFGLTTRLAMALVSK